MKKIKIIQGLALGMAGLAGTLAQAGPYRWVLSTVDIGEPGQWTKDTGYYNSLAVLPSGQPAVVYRQWGFMPIIYPKFKFAKLFGPSWQVEELSKTGGGEYANLAVNPATGLPALVHCKNAGTVEYMWFDGSTWRSETVQEHPMAWFTDCKLRYLPDGSPAVSYSEGASTGDVRYARRDLLGGWDVEVIDSTGPLPGPGFTSLVILKSGIPMVAYTDIRISGLRCAVRTGGGGGIGPWEISEIDRALGHEQNLGQGVDLQLLPNGQPAVSYYHLFGTNYALVKFARFDATNWHVEVVDTIKTAGDDASLAILPSGEPIIAYSDGTNHLKVAWRDSDGWHTEIVATSGATNDWRFGAWNSIQIMPNGLPAVSFYNLVADGEGDMTVAFAIREPAPGGPVITQAVMTAEGFVMRGTNGWPLAEYEVLYSTDITQPMTNWAAIATNVFDLDGAFACSNAIPDAPPQAFFRLRTAAP